MFGRVLQRLVGSWGKEGYIHVESTSFQRVGYSMYSGTLTIFNFEHFG